MRILMISEHFFPRIAGTSEYVHQTCLALSLCGQDVHLLVPGETDELVEINDYPYRVTALGVGWNRKVDPDRSTRYQFATATLQFAHKHLYYDRFDVVHVLFGSFVSEVFKTERFSNARIPCLQTVHNVPPAECRLSWTGDTLVNRFKDSLRLHVVARKNRFRLRKTRFDCYVVPSNSVNQLVASVLGIDARIETISHGYDESLAEHSEIPPSRAESTDNPIRLLTVGGWMPHKRQHLIPEIAHQLKESGIKFNWDIAGPNRKSARYRDAVLARIEALDLKENVNVLGPVSDSELARLYSNANLYVQPSTEEGFCMTALNAASLGLPVIGCPTGALPKLCKISGGALVPSSSHDIADAIKHFLAAGLWNPTALESAILTRERYSWLNAANQLIEIYRDLRPITV